jgi:uncharacterized protein
MMIVLTLLTLLFYKGNKNTKEVIVNTVRLSPDHMSRKETFNILQLSDLHMENLSITPEELYEKIKKYNIDLIALTGDYLDRKKSIPKLIPYLKVLKKLNVKYGMYAVFGNHDYLLKPKHFKKLIETFEQFGVKTMKNESKSLHIAGTKLNIIGIDDFSTNRSNIEKAYENVKNGFNLVLTHDPNIVLSMRNYHFNYLLSGHFHGGQIHWPKPYHLVKMGKLVRMNMIKGLNKIHGKPFYISEGLGQTGLNIRFGCYPEITIHEIVLTDDCYISKASSI